MRSVLLVFALLFLTVSGYGQKQDGSEKALLEKIERLERKIASMEETAKVSEALKKDYESARAIHLTVVKAAIEERENMEWHFRFLVYVAGIVCTILSSFLVWMGWKNQSTIKEAIDDKASELRSFLSSELTKMTQQDLEDVNSLILESSKMMELKRTSEVLVLNPNDMRFDIGSYLLGEGFKNVRKVPFEVQPWEGEIKDKIVVINDIAKKTAFWNEAETISKLQEARGVLYVGQLEFNNKDIQYVNFSNVVPTVRPRLLELLRATNIDPQRRSLNLAHETS